MRTLYRARLLVLVVAAVVLRLTVFAHAGAADSEVSYGLTLATGALTLADIAKGLDPDGKVARVINLLTQRNEILVDMLWVEGNLTTGNRTTVQTSIPAVYWRLANQGVPISKGSTAQIDEQCGWLEAWSEVDQRVAELGGKAKVNQVRLSRSKGYIEGMNQELASTLFYGSAASPEEFIGLTPRYNQKSGATNGDNVLLAGGTGVDNASIWLIEWGEEQVCGIYPLGSTAGLVHEDHGLQTVETVAGVAGSRMRAYQEHYQWDAGLKVADYRYAVRIANIDISDLAGTTPPDLIALMGDAEEIIPDHPGNRCFYMNRTLKRYLKRQMRNTVGSGGGLTYENVAGRRVMVFGETPVRTVDALLNSEQLVA